jgi:2-phosphosulfolactate phosphatase
MNVELVYRHEDFARKLAHGRTVVVIDVLRATTSITAMLMNGAESIIPVMTPEEAFDLREQEGYLLAGERNGLRIDGFDFGNSPLELTQERIAERAIVLCTSNGTQALVKASEANRVVTASFLNASAVARNVAGAGDDVVVLCAGTIGEYSLEDTVCGGMVISGLDGTLSGDAAKAVDEFRKYEGRLPECLRDSFHGQDLMRLGFEADLEYAAQTDATTIVPVLDESGRVVPQAGE